jgi:hypothetical protein
MSKPNDRLQALPKILASGTVVTRIVTRPKSARGWKCRCQAI